MARLQASTTLKDVELAQNVISSPGAPPACLAKRKRPRNEPSAQTNKQTSPNASQPASPPAKHEVLILGSRPAGRWSCLGVVSVVFVGFVGGSWGCEPPFRPSVQARSLLRRGCEKATPVPPAYSVLRAVPQHMYVRVHAVPLGRVPRHTQTYPARRYRPRHMSRRPVYARLSAAALRVRTIGSRSSQILVSKSS